MIGRGLTWEGDFSSSHSYAHVNREMVLALLRAGVSVRLAPRPRLDPGRCPPPLLWNRYASIRAMSQHTGTDARGGVAPGGSGGVHVRHSWPPDFHRPAGCARFVLIQPWEYGWLPRAWVDPIRANVDEVWAYSRHVRDTYVRSGIPAGRVAVVHPGVDPAVFSAAAPAATIPTSKGYRFLFVGGAATNRKGLDVLLRAYARAFRRWDDVCLVVKDYFYGPVHAQIAAARSDPDAPEIAYIYADADPWAMPGYYTACDCLVLPYRAEGFGLPALEAMACSRPAIVTGMGAALDFCDSSVAYLVSAREVAFPEARVGEFVTCGTPVWAEPDESHLADVLRHVFSNRGEAAEKGRLARERVLAGFTWDHAAREAVRRLAK